MAKTVQSRKAKGRRFQQQIAEKIRKAFRLSSRDAISRSMGAGGTDIILSEKAFEKFPAEIECKNHQRLNLWDSWDQAKANADEGFPLLLVKKNRSDTLAVLDFDKFLEIYKE